MEYHRKYTAGSNSRNPDRQMESLQLGGKHSKELPFITSLHFLSHSCNNKTNPYFIQFNMGGDDAVFALLTILLLAGLTSRQKVSWIKKFLVFLGSYSMNLWFLHSIFFTGSRPLQSILYWPQLSVAILAWGLMFLLPAAILCSNVQHHLWTILKVAAKQHNAHRQ